MKTSRSNPPGRRSRGGFSLAELMVVIVILGLLATLVVPRVMDSLGFGQMGVAKSDVTAIAGAVDDFYVKNGRWPDSIEQLVQKDETGRSYLNLDTVPTDPWGHPYVYEPPMGDQPPLIWCYGRDGSQGGEGLDQDFNNRMVKNKEI